MDDDGTVLNTFNGMNNRISSLPFTVNELITDDRRCGLWLLRLLTLVWKWAQAAVHELCQAKHHQGVVLRLVGGAVSYNRAEEIIQH